MDEFSGHGDAVSEIEINGKNCVSGSYDGSILAWELEDFYIRINERQLMHQQEIYAKKLELYNELKPSNKGKGIAKKPNKKK